MDYEKVIKLPYIAYLVTEYWSADSAATGVGRWDAVILFCAKTIVQFNEQLEELKKLFGNNLHEYIFITLIQAEHIGYKFIRPSVKDSLKTTPKFKLNILDKKD